MKREPVGLPRARGDGPASRSFRAVPDRASPRPRGWTVVARGLAGGAGGFPAPAGMDPAPESRPESGSGLPRARGDGPAPTRPGQHVPVASPRPRGWTLSCHVSLLSPGGFPAPAGMDREVLREGVELLGLPRARGDGPLRRPEWAWDAPASPRPRGWTRAWTGAIMFSGGFPAPAGMDPSAPSSSTPSSRLPRARGDGPHGRTAELKSAPASPRPRGWTVIVDLPDVRPLGFPAPAGMDPTRRASAWKWTGLPRARGDGPTSAPLTSNTIAASPRPRGWTGP